MRNTKPVGITFPATLLEEIDTRRGLIPRSKYVMHLIDKALKLEDSEGAQNTGTISTGLEDKQEVNR